MDWIRADWFSASPNHGQLHLCSGWVLGTAEREEGLHFCEGWGVRPQNHAQVDVDRCRVVSRGEEDHGKMKKVEVGRITVREGVHVPGEGVPLIKDVTYDTAHGDVNTFWARHNVPSFMLCLSLGLTRVRGMNLTR